MRITGCSRFRHVCELALLVAAFTTPFFAQSRNPIIAQSEETAPSRRAVRVKIYIGASQQMTFDAPIQSVTIVDAQTVKATVIGERVLLLTGLDFGETIVIVGTQIKRETMIAEIIGHPIEAPAAGGRAARGKSRTDQRASFGSYTIAFTPPSSNRSALLSQSLQYRQTLGSGRTLDLETSLFSTFGGQSEPLLAAGWKGVGVNRLSLALRNSDSSLEVLDNELNISPLTFSGYTIRGLHLTTTRNSILRGSEFFAGLARPSISLLNLGGGRIIGGVVPLASGHGWTIRGGAMAVSSPGSNDGRGGPLFLVDANYRQGENAVIQGELSYGGSAISWRGAAVIQRGAFNVSGEVSKLDNRSPVVALGAQGRGRSTLSGSLQWQPSARLVAFTSYSRNQSNQSSTSARISLSGSTLAAGVNYRFGSKTQFGFRYSQQAIDSASLSSFASQIRTKTLSANLTTRFSRHWDNTLETRYSRSSEARADAEMDRGYGFRDELRRSWEWASGSAYFNYQSSGQSLSSLIIRNPSLLPPLIRHEFEADPSRFLIMNRDLLSTFLSGIELPQAKSTDAGLRFQASISKYSLIGEFRYSNSEFGTQLRRDLLTTVNLGVRLNSANSINLSSAVSRPLGSSSSFGTSNGYSSFTSTLTHRFGGSSDGGFFLTRLLGLNHGAIKGRVFSDLNSNGEDDPEEPGIAGLKVCLDNGNTATTDQNGHFRFARVKPGNITVSLPTDDLGRRMRASTTNQQTVSVAPRETVNLSFGFFNFGFIAGRIFNDLQLSGKPESNDPPGISGVRIRLLTENPTTTNSAVTRVTDGSGIYEFRNLAPGKYTIQLDPDTLPPNFGAPVRTAWQLTVEAITGSYLDIPLVAQRRVSGVVFVDKDHDGKFDSQIDEAVAGAHVVAGRVDVITGSDGAYLLRGLPAGNLEIVAIAPWGTKSAAVAIILDPEPSIKRAVDLSVQR